MNLNTVVLGGRLSRDPELRHTSGGTAICSGGIAVNRKWKRGEEWVEEVLFIDFDIWGARGEAFARFHKKGDSALFSHAYLKMDAWDDKTTGQKRTKIKLGVDSWEFAGDRKSEGAGGPGGGSSGSQRGEAPQSSQSPAVDETPF